VKKGLHPVAHPAIKNARQGATGWQTGRVKRAAMPTSTSTGRVGVE